MTDQLFAATSACGKARWRAGAYELPCPAIGIIQAPSELEQVSDIDTADDGH